MTALKQAAKKNQHIVRLVAIMVVWMIFMAITQFSKFYTFGNFKTMASQFPEFGVMALGGMLCMMTGGIDLSSVGVANFTAICSAMLMTAMGGEAGVISAASFPLFVVLAFVIGGVIGAFNGFLVSKIRIPPILATLGVNELLTGVGIVMTGGAAYSSFPKEVTTLISSDIAGVLPVRLIIFVVVAVVIWFMLEKTTYGTKLRLLGTGEKVAVYSGMKTTNMFVRTYATSGICSAIGGLLMLGTYASARADYGSQYTLQAILIVVLGGVSPNGGKGKMSGVILAIFVLMMLQSGINRFPQISSYYISLIWGAVLILAMVMDYFTSDKRTRG